MGTSSKPPFSDTDSSQEIDLNKEKRTEVRDQPSDWLKKKAELVKEISGAQQAKGAREAMSRAAILKADGTLDAINNLDVAQALEAPSERKKLQALDSALLTVAAKSDATDFVEFLEGAEKLNLDPVEQSAIEKLKQVSADNPDVRQNYQTAWPQFSKRAKELGGKAKKYAEAKKKGTLEKLAKEDSFVGKMVGFAKEHPVWTAIIAGAGAYGLYRLARALFSDSGDKTPAASDSTAWKWAKRALYAGGTGIALYLAGKALGMKDMGSFGNAVPYFLQGEWKKGWDVMTQGKEVAEYSHEFLNRLEKNVGLKISPKTISDLSKVKYSDYDSALAKFKEEADKFTADITQNIPGATFLGFGDTEKAKELQAIRTYLEQHTDEISALNLASDATVVEVLEKLLDMPTKPAEVKKAEAAKETEKRAKVAPLLAPVGIARIYQWSHALRRFESATPATKAFYEAWKQKTWEQIFPRKPLSYQEALKHKPRDEFELLRLQKQETLDARAKEIRLKFEQGNGKHAGFNIDKIMQNPDHPERRGIMPGELLEDHRTVNLTQKREKFWDEFCTALAKEEIELERATISAKLKAMESPRAWQKMINTIVPAKSVSEFSQRVADFEKELIRDTSVKQFDILTPSKIKEFEKLGNRMGALLENQNALMRPEMESILRLKEAIDKDPSLKIANEAKMAEHLTNIAQLETNAMRIANRFVEENAAAFKESLQISGWKKFPWKEDMLESYHPPLKERIMQPLKFGSKGTKIMLVGIGAAGILEYFRKEEKGPAMAEVGMTAGKIAAGFIPIAAEAVDIHDAAKAFLAGDVTEGLVNTGFFVGDLATDLTYLIPSVGPFAKGALVSAKAARAAQKGIKGAKEVTILSNAEEVAKSGKIVMKIVAEGGQTFVRKVAIDAAKLEKLGVFARVQKFTAEHQKTLQRLGKFGFATGAAFALGQMVVPLVEYAFGDHTGAEIHQLADQSKAQEKLTE